MNRLTLLPFALAALSFACGGVAEDGAPSEDGLGESSEAVTVDFHYDCSGFGAAGGEHLTIWLKSSTATLTNSAQGTATGRLDATYHSTAATPKSRYKGFSQWGSAAPTVLVSRSMRSGGGALNSGGRGGFADLTTGTGSRRVQKSYVCRVVSATPPAPTAEAPIPYVLQWINDYRGPGYVSRLNLRRDGTYDATVGLAANATVEHGLYFGPRTVPTTPGIDLRLVAAGGTRWSANLTLYSSTSAVVTRDGHTVTLHATLPTDGEDACDSGNGSYLDDDANGAGLYCACPDGLEWIPSQGGCIP
jgi:hypothetical protein